MKKMKKAGKYTAKIMIIVLCVMLCASIHVFASNAGTIVEQKFSILKDLITSVISSIGTIYTLWGISELGMSLQSQDGTMQAQAFKRIAGGLVIMLAPQLIALF